MSSIPDPSGRTDESRHRGSQVVGGIALLVVGALWSLFWFVMWALGSSDFASGVSTGVWVVIYGALALGLVAIASAIALLLGRRGGRSMLARTFRVLAIMAGAIAILGAGAYFSARGEEPQSWSDDDPAWSPRADAIAFSSSRGESDGIYLVRSDGSGMKRVSPMGDAYYPSWSPDGRKLVVERLNGSALGVLHSSLWVIDLHGGKPHRLLRVVTRFEDEPLRPAWSPEGEWIAFSKPLGSGGSAIYLISTDGKRLRRLTPRRASGTFQTHPSWSPDGRRLAFTTWSSAHGAASIAMVNVDGTGEVRLTEGREPSWSPNGRRIAFRCHAGICLLAPTRPERHRTLALGGAAPAWAPDSSRIVFTRQTGHGHYFAGGSYGTYALSVVDAARGEARDLTAPASKE